MTTAPRLTASAGGAVPVGAEVRRAGLTTLGAVVVIVVVAGPVAGGPAATGAVIGGAMTLVLFLLGALLVDAVATVSPRASLVVALLTYALQVVLFAAVLVVLTGSALLEGAVDRGWLGGSVIVTTLVWTAAHIRAQTRSRVPLYLLHPAVHEPSRQAPDAGAR